MATHFVNKTSNTEIIQNGLTEFPPFNESWSFYKLTCCFKDTICSAIESPYSYDQLRKPPISSNIIKPLINSLKKSYHPGIVASLMAVQLEFTTTPIFENENSDSNARSFATQLIAILFLNSLKDKQVLIQYLTYELISTEFNSVSPISHNSDEETALLGSNNNNNNNTNLFNIENEPPQFLYQASVGLNTIEIAILGEARKFLASTVVQNVITDIWTGKIVFWEKISLNSCKKAIIYDKAKCDLFSRLRVPRYRSIFISINYAILLFFYLFFLFSPISSANNPSKTYIGPIEICLIIWFAGFLYEEISQISQSGNITIYINNYWNFFDLITMFIFISYLSLRIIGIWTGLYSYSQLSFDILSLESLLLIPRVFSHFSIIPYFGTLIPCLRDLTVEFIKFLSIILVVYFGFLSTFTYLGHRSGFTAESIMALLIRVFFGSSYAGFDLAPLISPEFGFGLMLLFITLTNVLLITVMISILSQRFSIIMLNAKEEYMLMFSSTVLEVMTTSDKVTYFYPPLNLFSIFLKPIRPFVSNSRYRLLRITLLKITHLPYVAVIGIYEYFALGNEKIKHSLPKFLMNIFHHKRTESRSLFSSSNSFDSSINNVNTPDTLSCHDGYRTIEEPNEEGFNSINNTLISPWYSRDSPFGMVSEQSPSYSKLHNRKRTPVSKISSIGPGHAGILASRRALIRAATFMNSERHNNAHRIYEGSRVSTTDTINSPLNKSHKKNLSSLHMGTSKHGQRRASSLNLDTNKINCEIDNNESMKSNPQISRLQSDFSTVNNENNYDEHLISDDKNAPISKELDHDLDINFQHRMNSAKQSKNDSIVKNLETTKNSGISPKVQLDLSILKPELKDLKTEVDNTSLLSVQNNISSVKPNLSDNNFQPSLENCNKRIRNLENQITDLNNNVLSLLNLLNKK